MTKFIKVHPNKVEENKFSVSTGWTSFCSLCILYLQYYFLKLQYYSLTYLTEGDLLLLRSGPPSSVGKIFIFTARLIKP